MGIRFLALKDGGWLSNIFANPNRMSRVDQRISERMGRAIYDYEGLKEYRARNRAEITKLQSALERTNDRKEISKEEKETIKDIRSYEKALRRQLLDVSRILTLSKRLIENEDLEVMYDLRQPLMAIDNFLDYLQRTVKKIRIAAPEAHKLEVIIKDIEKQFEELADKTLKLEENRLNYFSRTGATFNSINLSMKKEYSLADHMRNRSMLKRQINGKTQYILQQLKKLENTIIKLRESMDPLAGERLLQLVSYFRSQFAGLIEFCMKRIEISTYTIIESLDLQMIKYGELKRINEDLQNFYNEFYREQSRLYEMKKSEFHKNMIDRRIAEFRKYQQQAGNEFTKFKKDFEKKIEKIENKDKEYMQSEMREGKRVWQGIAAYLKGFKKKVAVGLITLAAITTVGAVRSPSYSTLGTVRDSVVQLIKVTDYSDILRLISEGKLQVYIDNVSRKAARNERFNEQDEKFIKALYQFVAGGGLISGKGEASRLLNHYLSGKGGTIELNPGIYKSCPAVKNAMNLMEQEILNDYKKGKLPAKGVVDSCGMIRGTTNSKDLEHSGILPNGYIKAGLRDSPDLFYSDRRFKLRAEYSISGGKIDHVIWSVTSKYAFVEKTGKVTPIPIPGIGKTIRLPHVLSVKIGKVFDTHSQWSG